MGSAKPWRNRKKMAVDGLGPGGAKWGGAWKEDTNNNNPKHEKHNLFTTRTFFLSLPLFYSFLLCSVQLPFTRMSIRAAYGTKESGCCPINIIIIVIIIIIIFSSTTTVFFTLIKLLVRQTKLSVMVPGIVPSSKSKISDQWWCLDGIDLMNHLLFLNTTILRHSPWSAAMVLFIVVHLLLSLLQRYMVKETQSMVVSWFEVILIQSEIKKT